MSEGYGGPGGPSVMPANLLDETMQRFQRRVQEGPPTPQIKTIMDPEGLLKVEDADLGGGQDAAYAGTGGNRALRMSFGTSATTAQPSRFTLVSGSPATIGAYTVSFDGDVNWWDLGGMAGINGMLYNNAQHTITLNIAGLSPGAYSVTAGAYQGGVPVRSDITPGTGTAGPTLTVANDGGAYTFNSPQVQNTGVFTVSGSTLQLVVSGWAGKAGENGPRIDSMSVANSPQKGHADFVAVRVSREE
ncbi:MAG: hypothetical protein WCK89_10115 [bacterium]